MVVVKTARELSKMKDACRISAEALRVAGEAVKRAFPLTMWLSMAYPVKNSF